MAVNHCTSETAETNMQLHHAWPKFPDRVKKLGECDATGIGGTYLVLPRPAPLYL